MALMNTPKRGVVTRSMGSAETSEVETLLQAATEELRQLREERVQQRLREQEIITLLAQRDESVRRLEERIGQISGESNPISLNRENLSHGLGYKLKPDIYDGSVPLREFLAQFNFIARANNWNESAKTVALATSLRGKARAVLDGVEDFEKLRYNELESRLLLRFGEEYMAQTFYAQFTNRKQKFGEDLPTLGAELERLCRLAYPECTSEIRDKIASAQFIAALSDGFLRRTLQLEGVTSLRTAIERAMAVKVIQENSFTQKQENYKGRDKFQKGNENWRLKKDFKLKPRREQKECWQCGAQGHFRADCPSLQNKEKGNLD